MRPLPNFGLGQTRHLSKKRKRVHDYKINCCNRAGTHKLHLTSKPNGYIRKKNEEKLLSKVKDFRRRWQIRMTKEKKETP